MFAKKKDIDKKNMVHLSNSIEKICGVLIFFAMFVVLARYIVKETILPFYGIITKVEIYKITGGTKAEWIHYKYVYNGKEFHGSSLSGGFTKGDSINIEFWPVFPSINRVCRGQSPPHHPNNRDMFYDKNPNAI